MFGIIVVKIIIFLSSALKSVILCSVELGARGQRIMGECAPRKRTKDPGSTPMWMKANEAQPREN